MERDCLPLHTDFGIIRPARPEDTDQIIKMVGRLATHHGDIPTLEPAIPRRDLFSEKPWIHVIVAEADDSLVGYAALCGLINLHLGKRGMDMHHLFIEASFRGKGIGRGLVEGCKIHARSMSCGYLTVGTHPENHRAQAFYDAIGFDRKDAHPPKFSLQLAS